MQTLPSSSHHHLARGQSASRQIDSNAPTMRHGENAQHVDIKAGRQSLERATASVDDEATSREQIERGFHAAI